MKTKSRRPRMQASIAQMIFNPPRVPDQLREATLNYLDALTHKLNRSLAPQDKHLAVPGNVVACCKFEHKLLEYKRRLKNF